MESAIFDHAKVQVSTNGTGWTSIWDHTGSTLQETSWQRVTYALPSYVGGRQTVYIRWGMGPTDGSAVYSGWNIDDIVVTGTPLHPVSITVTPASCDFGSVQVGLTSNLTFTVRNSGAEPLTGSATVPAPYGIVSGCPYSLGAGASQVVTVRYSPTAVGTHNQTVTFTGGAGTTRPVTGSAYTPVPVLSVTPSSQDFGAVRVGTSATRAFTVRNAGGGTLSGASGGVSAPYSIVSGSPYILGAGASQTVTVRYIPALAGVHNQTVSFTGGGGANRSITARAYVPWDSGAMILVDGWIWLDWFGYCNRTLAPWIRHETHGVLYCQDDTFGGVWMYDAGRGIWWWTSPPSYPWMWSYNGVSGRWLGYYLGSTNPRFFYDLASGQWEAWSP